MIIRRINEVLYAVAVIVLLAGCGGNGQSGKLMKHLTDKSEMSLHWDQWGKLYDDNTLVGYLYPNVPPSITAVYDITPLSANTFKVEWRLIAGEDIDDAHFSVEFVNANRADFWMIPAVSYNGNEWGRGHEPKGAQHNWEWRTYSYRRTPIPGAVYSEAGDYAVATCGTVPHLTDEDYSCSIVTEDSLTRHRLIWPEEEMPVWYCSSDTYGDGWQRHASVKSGDTKMMTMLVFVEKTQPQHKSMNDFLSGYWKEMPHPAVPVPSDKEIWDGGINFVKRSLWTQDGIFSGFISGLINENGTLVKRTDMKYEAGWCGQNISLGCSLLYDYIINKNEESLEMGLKVLDCWAKYCTLPNGLFITHFDDILNNKQQVLDAVNLGQVAWGYFDAYNLAERCGRQRPEYLNVALGICNFMVFDQQKNGCFGRGWSWDGKCVFREGTSGCALVGAMMAAYKQTHKDKYLESAEKAFEFYYSQMSADGYSTAGALDTWCIDRESALPLLASALGLCKLTGQRQYLDAALQVSYYLSTWMWHYDGVYPEDDAFTKYDYHTFGATAMSVQQNYLDCTCCALLPAWRILSMLSGDSQWREKAEAIWANSCQLISDGAQQINGIVRPKGSQTESFYHCAWAFDYDTKYDLHKMPSSSISWRINDWLSAWPVAFHLSALQMMGYGQENQEL